MGLIKAQIERVQQIWQVYVDSGKTFLNASKEFTQEELDQARRDTIPEVRTSLWPTSFPVYASMMLFGR